MFIKKIYIKNFKCIKEHEFTLNKGLNIFVWDNWVWKSTVLEAIDLVLSWRYRWKYLWTELNQWLFNKESVDEYLKSIKSSNIKLPPEIIIELFFWWIENDSLKAEYEWSYNHNNSKECWIRFEIKIDELWDNLSYYNSLEKITTLPIDLYEYTWTSFSRDPTKPKKFNNHFSSTFIDSSIYNYQYWWDVSVFKAVKDSINKNDRMQFSSQYREMQNWVSDHLDIINSRLKDLKFSEKEVSIWVDYQWRDSWDKTLNIYIWGVPFNNCWKWEQCKIKTKIILGWRDVEKSNILLIEEPENHLSYLELSKLINFINDNCWNKQIFITTHSSFVINKLSINNLILLSNDLWLKHSDFSEISNDTYEYFLKLSWYDTLRYLLCPRVILVEWPSDDLIVQRAYYDMNWKLPIDDWIDIIAVWLSAPRFLELWLNLDKKIAVITDNDHNYEEKIVKRYKKYEANWWIKIFSSYDNEKNTLEPNILDSNKWNIDDFVEVIECPDVNNVLKYMINNKTDYALKIFNSNSKINYPQYILDAIKFINNDKK